MDHDGETFLFNMVQEYSVVFLWVNALVTDSRASQYWADIHIGKDEELKSKKVTNCQKNSKYLNLNENL